MNRTYTEKEKLALAAAWRTLVLRLFNKRLNDKRALEFLDGKAAEGLTADELLNPANYLPPDEKGNILMKENPVRLTDTEGWYEGDSFALVAECVHDFYLRLTGKGGQWTTKNSRDNLARAIREDGIDTILSEELVSIIDAKNKEKNGEEATLSCFAYIENVIRELWRLKKEQPQPEEPAEETAGNDFDGYDEATEGTKDAPECVHPNPFEDPDLIPSPDRFDTDIIPLNTPRNNKRNAIALNLANYSIKEIANLAECVLYKDDEEEEKLADGGISLNVLIDKLTDGEFSPKSENAEARKMHMSLNGDLNGAFVTCVRQIAGVDMDAEMAQNYDILHIDWDLRDPGVRKFYKLKQLILESRDIDRDLLDAIDDLERLYLTRPESE